MDFQLWGIHVQQALLFAGTLNKNLNCQSCCQQPHHSTLRRNSLSCREHQLRWHLMRIIIIMRLHVYFRFLASNMKLLWRFHTIFFFLLPHKYTHKHCKSTALCHCLLWSLWLYCSAAAAPLISLHHTFCSFCYQNNHRRHRIHHLPDRQSQ